jgi:hypothetical protein
VEENQSGQTDGTVSTTAKCSYTARWVCVKERNVFRHTEFELLSTADMKCLAEY